mmetsp:Transcript_35015/g.70816  ORF Transcript_35015/g.70816 Transcript_35015/m.70816 type:complete len:292 (-) Transcript_35015:1961-2836(-)
MMRIPSTMPLTYALGRSLYVPLTCRCNTVTLPQTRGPGFVLPRDVVASLLEVRRLELGVGETPATGSTRLGDLGGIGGSENSNGAKASLPPLDVSTIYSLDDSDTDTRRDHPITDRIICSDIETRFKEAKRSGMQYDSLVIAGEGEPTLRLSTLLSVASRPMQSSCFVYTKPTIRVVTNGLCSAIPGNDDCLVKLKEAGVTGLSVALMTASPSQYDELMRPCLPPGISEPAHGIVCNFVREAVSLGLNVEITAVDRNDIDKKSAGDLALSLGVSEPIRWRPYYPSISSVGS